MQPLDVALMVLCSAVAAEAAKRARKESLENAEASFVASMKDAQAAYIAVLIA